MTAPGTAWTAALVAGVATGYGLKCYIEQQRKCLLSKAAASTENAPDTKQQSQDLSNVKKIIYAVQVKISLEALPDFESWLPKHIKDLLKLPGFVSAESYKCTTIEKPTVVFVLGGPGAGKGTQCQKIVDEFGYTHISAGDCLRAERNTNSSDAQLINQYIREGKIVPVEITVRLLKKAMDTSGNRKFLIDGFPRNEDNVHGWFQVIGDFVNVPFVLFLDCPEKVMESRLLERGKTSGRIDDNLESIQKRFRTYQEETRRIISHFKEQDKVRHVLADDSIGAVWERVKKVMSELEMRPAVQEYSIQYSLESHEALQRYLVEYAPKMRNQVPQGLKKHMQVIQRSSWSSSELQM